MNCRQCSVEIQPDESKANSGLCQRCANPVAAPKLPVTESVPEAYEATVEKPAPKQDETLIKAWKRSIDDQLHKNKTLVNKVFKLVDFLNQQPNMRLAYMHYPKMRQGCLAHLTDMCNVYMVYDLPEKVAKVPKTTQLAFLKLINLLVENYDVLDFSIGFQATMRMRASKEELDYINVELESDTLRDCPMVRIGLQL